MSTASAGSLARSFFIVGLMLGVGVILYTARVWMVPLALALLLAFILTPVVDWLERQRLRRSWAVALVAIVALITIVAAGYMVTTQLGSLAARLQEKGEKYKDNVTKKLAPVLDMLQAAQDIEDVGKKGPANRPAAQADTQADAQKPAPVPVVVESHGIAMLSWLPAVVWPVIEIGVESLLVVALAIFILLQRENLRDRVLGLLGQRNLAGATRAFNDTGTRVSRFLFLLLAMNVFMGVGVGVGLYFIGVPYALLWGFLTAALRFIPYIGVWAAAALPCALSAAIFPDWTEMLLVLALYLALELLMFNVLEPLLFGHGTGVAPLPLLVAALFWSWLWGPAGLLLSTPLTVCLVVLGRHVPALRFLDVLLGAQPALDEAARYYQRLLAGDLDEASVILQNHLRERPLDVVCDDMVLPALARARRERDEDDLSAEEERAVLRGTRVLLNSVLAAEIKTNLGGTSANGEPLTQVAPPRVLGCPAHGPADAVALQLLGLLLHQAGCELKLVSQRRLADEANAQARDREPVVVCVGTLPPGGITHAAYVCRITRQRVPLAKVVVGRWGRGEEKNSGDERLRTAGAARTASTLRETVEEILGVLGRERPAPAPPAQAATPVPAAAH